MCSLVEILGCFKDIVTKLKNSGLYQVNFFVLDDSESCGIQNEIYMSPAGITIQTNERN